MTTTAAATAAPVEITLGGTKYRLSPLVLRDYGEFDQWMREQALEQLNSESVKSLPDNDRRALHRHIHDQAAKLSLASPPLTDLDALQLNNRILSSTSAAARLLWLGMRRNDPDLDLDEIEALLSDPDVLDQAMADYDRVNETGTKKKPTTATDRSAAD